MARSKYIYLIRSISITGLGELPSKLLGAFTVKHEAILWALRNDCGPHNARFSRIRDGVFERKDEDEIPWNEERSAGV